MHRGAIAPYWTITHWICHGCSGREGTSSRAIARPDAPKQTPPAVPGLARAGGCASRLPPTLASRPAHPVPVLRRPPLPGQQILSDADASLPGIAGPRLPSPGLACTRPAPPSLARAGGRASCLPPAPCPLHRDPRTPSRWTSARLHAARLAPMYPGMADERTPPLKICTTSLTWSRLTVCSGTTLDAENGGPPPPPDHRGGSE